MTVGRMHDDEIEIDDDVVRRLIDTQLPEWSDRSITRVESDGTGRFVMTRIEEYMQRNVEKLAFPNDPD